MLSKVSIAKLGSITVRYKDYKINKAEQFSVSKVINSHRVTMIKKT